MAEASVTATPQMTFPRGISTRRVHAVPPVPVQHASPAPQPPSNTCPPLRHFTRRPVLPLSMVLLFLASLLSRLPCATAGRRLDPVPLHRVLVGDSFWSHRQVINRESTFQHAVNMLLRGGHLANFEAARDVAHRVASANHEHKGGHFADCDVFRVIEAGSFISHTQTDALIGTALDNMIQLVASAQMPDGYLSTIVQLTGAKRFSDLRRGHELYCGGMLIEAGVAHFQATQKRSLLDVAMRFATLLHHAFGPGGQHEDGYGGHPGVEVALVKLYKVTGDRRWLTLAASLLDRRGLGTSEGAEEEEYKEEEGEEKEEDHGATREQLVREGHGKPAARGVLQGHGTLEGHGHGDSEAWHGMRAGHARTSKGHGTQEAHGVVDAPRRRSSSQHMDRYYQDDIPIRVHTGITGHVVPTLHLMMGAADVLREGGMDSALAVMLVRVWRSVVDLRLYVTGGVGASHPDGGVGAEYDLPNLHAHQETCASVAMALWGHRMALLFGHASYMDVVERTLYNAVASGVSLSGKSFFHTNPLASHGDHHRHPWPECACCPSSALQAVASVGSLAYAVAPRSLGRLPAALYVHLYIAGSMQATLDDMTVSFHVKSDYPWHGDVVLHCVAAGAGTFRLMMRKPSWCGHNATVAVVHGRGHQHGGGFTVPSEDVIPADRVLDEDGYWVVERTWAPGDAVHLHMPMPVLQMQAHPRVVANLGRTVFQKGPLVYCAEQADNEGIPLDAVVVPVNAPAVASIQHDLLGGVIAIEVEGTVPGYSGSPTVVHGHSETPEWSHSLYMPMSRHAEGKPVQLRLIPYAYWDNRGSSGAMSVWLRNLMV
eukprot:jgi/Mesvir1/1290/Mv03758-RA.1